MSSLPTPKRQKPTPEQLAGLISAGKRAKELRDRGELDLRCGQDLVDSLGDGGHLTWASSPHVMWLARQLARGGKA